MRVRLGWFLTVECCPGLQGLQCAGVVEVNDRIELVDKAGTGVMALPFDLWPVHDADGPLQ
jgi:hypothetical protein